MTGKGWLDRLTMLRLFASKTQVDKLITETVKAKETAGELQKVLEAKKELARARAENTRLRKEIAEVSERTVDKDKEPPPVKPPRQKY